MCSGHRVIAALQCEQEGMDPLGKLTAEDLELLLLLEPERALGRIVELNNDSRYRNSLNVIEVLVRLRELREVIRNDARHRHDRRVA